MPTSTKRHPETESYYERVQEFQGPWFTLLSWHSGSAVVGGMHGASRQQTQGVRPRTPRPRPRSRPRRRRDREALAAEQQHRTVRPPEDRLRPTGRQRLRLGTARRQRRQAMVRQPQPRQATARQLRPLATELPRPARRAEPDRPQPQVERPPDRAQRQGEQQPDILQHQPLVDVPPQVPPRVACLTQPAAHHPKAARCAVLRKAMRFGCAPVADPVTCMSLAATWTSIMDWPATGASRWNARIIPASSPSAAAVGTFNIPICIAGTNTVTGLTTSMGEPMTGSTRAIPITAFT